MSLTSRELTREPGARGVPVVVHRAHGDAQRFGRSSRLNPPKKRNSTTRLARGATAARTVKASPMATTSVDGSGAGGSKPSSDTRPASSRRLVALTCSRRVHQDASHDCRGGREEMLPILPMDGLLPSDEAQVRFEDELRGLPAVSGLLAGEDAPRQDAELRLEERRQLIERISVPAAPRLQQAGQLTTRFHPDSHAGSVSGSDTPSDSASRLFRRSRSSKCATAVRHETDLRMHPGGNEDEKCHDWDRNGLPALFVNPPAPAHSGSRVRLHPQFGSPRRIGDVREPTTVRRRRRAVAATEFSRQRAS